MGLRLNDDDKIEKNMQKKALEKQLADEIKLKKAEFRHYLKRDYSLHPIPNSHRTLSNSIKDQFDGRASRALRGHLYENIREAEVLNKRFEQFLENF